MTVSGRPRALYHQIADKIRVGITSGELRPGERLPTEADIAREWETSRSTAVKGLGVLIGEGLVVAQRPRGHFVRARQPMVYRPQSEFRPQPEIPEMDRFIAQLTQEGREASQRIEVSIVEPDADIRERLRLSTDSRTVVRRRVRYVDGVAYNTNDSYFPYALVEGSDIMSPGDIARGANTVLAELGHEQVRALDEIHVRMPTPEEADRLQLGPGTPVAVHVCTGYTKSGVAVRAVVNVLPGDRHVITYERAKPKFGPFTVRAAEPSELSTVVELWEEAAAWLNERNIDQWQYAPRTARIEENLRAGEVFFVEDPSGVVATITLDSHADDDFWTAPEADEPAMYAHRMVVRRNASGSNLGSSMIDWASQRAQSNGAKWLRLDAWRSNDRLGDYYRGLGFTHLRTVPIEGRGSGALYQRPAGEVRGTGPVLTEGPGQPMSP